MRNETDLFSTLSKHMHLPRAPYFVVETPKLHQPAACCPHLWGYHTAAMATFIITTMIRQYYKSNRTDVSGTAITWVTCIGLVSGIGGTMSKKLVYHKQFPNYIMCLFCVHTGTRYLVVTLSIVQELYRSRTITVQEHHISRMQLFPNSNLFKHWAFIYLNLISSIISWQNRPISQPSS